MAGSPRSSGSIRPARVRVTGNGADRLAVLPVDDRSLVTAECADAVAGSQEREVRGDHLVEQAVQVGLDPQLHW